MADGEDHTQPHTATCTRCLLVVTYWGPLGNKACPRCGLWFKFGGIPEYRTPEGLKLAVTLIVVVAALLVFVLSGLDGN
ncbi:MULTISPECIES: hypothetical protein [Streptomyces]|uniref:hypothetical protein n=1 Tax=Streptomyces TaxID=1883 RepID=UPI000515CA90|nr:MULTISPECIES: hypothetical protein [Streptomyces]WSU72661.1 hypothetical protein OG499_06770 [Streptomyces anulatus]WTD28950.1 hypothetical protein OH737_32500 [Streptomyces anulatus]